MYTYRYELPFCICLHQSKFFSRGLEPTVKQLKKLKEANGNCANWPGFTIPKAQADSMGYREGAGCEVVSAADKVCMLEPLEGEPKVSAAKYACCACGGGNKLDFDSLVEATSFDIIDENGTAIDVEEALARMKTGDMEQGLALSTDHFMSDQVRVESFFWMPFLHLHKPSVAGNINMISTGEAVGEDSPLPWRPELLVVAKSGVCLGTFAACTSNGNEKLENSVSGSMFMEVQLSWDKVESEYGNSSMTPSFSVEGHVTIEATTLQGFLTVLLPAEWGLAEYVQPIKTWLQKMGLKSDMDPSEFHFSVSL